MRVFDKYRAYQLYKKHLELCDTHNAGEEKKEDAVIWAHEDVIGGLFPHLQYSRDRMPEELKDQRK